MLRESLQTANFGPRPYSTSLIFTPGGQKNEMYEFLDTTTYSLLYHREHVSKRVCRLKFSFMTSLGPQNTPPDPKKEGRLREKLKIARIMVPAFSLRGQCTKKTLESSETNYTVIFINALFHI